MKRATYPTPQDAEAAFYEALERSDLEAMMEVWAEDEEIVCVHPTGPRLAGYDAIRESWSQMFRTPQRIEVRLSHQVYVQGMMLSIHSVHENFRVVDDPRPRAPIIATNVYLRTPGGWRMLVHHASPAPASAGSTAAEAPKILH
jgi:ketosteroid isomerase-like protein